MNGWIKGKDDADFPIYQTNQKLVKLALNKDDSANFNASTTWDADYSSGYEKSKILSNKHVYFYSLNVDWRWEWKLKKP